MSRGHRRIPSGWLLPAWIIACAGLLLTGCSEPTLFLDVVGDAGAAGASWSVDGQKMGTLRATRHSGPELRARDGIMVFGGEQPDEVVLLPKEKIFASEFIELPRAPHRVEVISTLGEALAVTAPIGEYVHIEVSTLRRAIHARVEH